MKYYQEITLLPDAEVTENHIWEKVYQQLHLAIANSMQEGEKGRLGVSFPDYTVDKVVKLGRRLRIFADTEAELQHLDMKKWLLRYMDYVHIKQIRPVPDKKVSGYAIYRRYHQEANSFQKARRYARRHNISYDEALELFPVHEPERNLPYVQLRSETNQHKYRLYIEQIPHKEPVSVGFGSYGLDSRSTVPVF